MRESSTGGFLFDRYQNYQRGRWISTVGIGYACLAAVPVVLILAFTPLWSSPTAGLSLLPFLLTAGVVYLAVGKIGQAYWDGKLRQELGLWLRATYGVKFTDDEVKLLWLGEEVLRDGRYWAVHIRARGERGFTLDSEPEDIDGSEQPTA